MSTFHMSTFQTKLRNGIPPWEKYEYKKVNSPLPKTSANHLLPTGCQTAINSWSGARDEDYHYKYGTATPPPSPINYATLLRYNLDVPRSRATIALTSPKGWFAKDRPRFYSTESQSTGSSIGSPLSTEAYKTTWYKNKDGRYEKFIIPRSYGSMAKFASKNDCFSNMSKMMARSDISLQMSKQPKYASSSNNKVMSNSYSSQGQLRSAQWTRTVSPLPRNVRQPNTHCYQPSYLRSPKVSAELLDLIYTSDGDDNVFSEAKRSENRRYASYRQLEKRGRSRSLPRDGYRARRLV